MKKVWDKYKKHTTQIVIAVIFFTFVIPIIINWLYKTPALLPIFAMDWEGKDALSFYGSILGAAATIIALTSTIKFTRENQREERKLSIRPYLETHKYDYTNFDDIPEGKGIIYLDIKPNIITYQGDLPDDISEIQNLKSRTAFEGNYSTKYVDKMLYKTSVLNYFKNKYLLYYEIINCGAGNAINLNLKIDGREILPSFCVTTNESKKFILILNKELLEHSGEHNLKISLVYQDVASIAQYYQTEEILFKNINGSLNTVQFPESLLTNPVEIPKETN